ncbi:MAG: DNA polymerase III subunit delta [Alphaproteobacteria bacterium]|nr:DNA polymerase III subunit delta [Alphaproteobacteria bacterium]
MKKSGKAALDFCSAPPKNVRCVLLFGEDPGLIEAAALGLVGRWIAQLDPMNVVRLTDDELRKDPGVLEDHLSARSLMGGDSLVRVKTEKDTSARILTDTLKRIEVGSLFQEAFCIVEAGELPKTSRLRSAWEASPVACALELSPDDEDDVVRLVRESLSVDSIDVEGDALAAFCSELAGNRRLALSEIEKLRLYGMGLNRSVNVADIKVFSSGEIARGADDAADAAVLGDLKSADIAIDRFLESGGSPITALRVLHLRILRASNARSTRVQNGSRLWPPITDQDWPAYSAALRYWTPGRIIRALQCLHTTETACKAAGSPAEALLRHALHEIADRGQLEA